MKKFTVSLFNNKNDNKPKEQAWMWDKLLAYVKNPEVRKNKDGPLFSPARFLKHHRLKENVVEICWLVLDCDHCLDIKSVINTLKSLKHRFVIYSTHSHKRKTESNPDASPCYRIVIELAEPIPTRFYPSLWLWAQALLKGVVDEATKDSSRMSYLPAIYSEDAPYEHWIVDGKPLDWQPLGLVPSKEEAEKPTSKNKLKKSEPKTPQHVTLEDKQIIALAKQRYGAKFERLHCGDSSGYLKPSGEPDVSRADCAFVTVLLLCGATHEQIERIWRSSLRNREKLTNHQTYIQRTVDRAELYLASNQEILDISEFEEIEDDDYPIVLDEKREKYLRQLARNAGKVMEAYAIILKLLGFEKNHMRFLSALTAIGRDRLGTFVAAQDWLRQKYQESKEASSEETVRRDIKKFCGEQASLGVTLISYTPGTMNAKGDRFASQFKNNLLRYALEAISISIDTREDFPHSSAALEEACNKIIERIPRIKPITPEKKGKNERMKTLPELESKHRQCENAIIEKMLYEGWSQLEIEAEFEELEEDRKKRVSECFRVRLPEKSQKAHG